MEYPTHNVLHLDLVSITKTERGRRRQFLPCSKTARLTCSTVPSPPHLIGTRPLLVKVSKISPDNARCLATRRRRPQPLLCPLLRRTLNPAYSTGSVFPIHPRYIERASEFGGFRDRPRSPLLHRPRNVALIYLAYKDPSSIPRVCRTVFHKHIACRAIQLLVTTNSPEHLLETSVPGSFPPFVPSRSVKSQSS